MLQIACIQPKKITVRKRLHEEHILILRSYSDIDMPSRINKASFLQGFKEYSRDSLIVDMHAVLIGNAGG